MNKIPKDKEKEYYGACKCPNCINISLESIKLNHVVLLRIS